MNKPMTRSGGCPARTRFQIACLLVVKLLAAGAVQGGVTFEVIASYQYPRSASTSANGIRDDGTVVGTVDDQMGDLYGYIRRPNGGFSQLISYPGSHFTGVLGTNNLGQICGYYNGGARPGDGFLAQQGRFVTADFPKPRRRSLWA